jgi:hypothetical protein
MSNVASLKKPTLKSLAAEMRRLQERIEDMEDLIELRSAIEPMPANRACHGSR